MDADGLDGLDGLDSSLHYLRARPSVVPNSFSSTSGATAASEYLHLLPKGIACADARPVLSQRRFDLFGKFFQPLFGGLLAGAEFLSVDGDFEFFQ